MLQLYSPEIGEARKQRILRLVASYPYLLRHHIRPGCLCAPPEQHIPKKHRLLLHENIARRNLPETRHEVELSKSTNDMLLKVSNNVMGDEYDDECEKQCWVDKRHLPWCLFRPTSLPQIARAENRPLWVCDRMAAVMMQIPYGPNFSSRERLTLLKMVDSLTNAIGQCERIHQTAVPLNYARHSLRSLTLWLFTLPFALVKDMGLFTAPVNACIAWLLFGVYQIGYSIEDPFQGSLRLSILCDAIRRNVIGQSEELRDSAFRLVNDSTVYHSEFDLSPTSTTISSSEYFPLVDQKLLSAPNFLDSTGPSRKEVGI
jgi:Bestrophin, RFP-TM, chloride channel